MCCFTGFFSKLLDVRSGRPGGRRHLAWGVGRLAGQRQAGLPGFWAWGRGVPDLGIATGLARCWCWWRWCRWRPPPAGGHVSLYNYLRWGSITSTGYGVAITSSGIETGPGVHEHPLVGLWGMFLSPGKSIFLYSPPLLVACVGLLRFTKNFRHIVLAMVLTIVPGLYVHAQMISWAGDYAWGPRYMTFALGILLLPAGFVVQECLNHAQSCCDAGWA
jgi:hypothetical protein